MTNIFRNLKYWFLSGLIAILMVAGGGAANAKAVGSQAKQFDIVCQLHGKFIANPNGMVLMGIPGKETKWTLPVKMLVDLSSMKYCYIGECRRYGLNSIASVTRSKIVFSKNEWRETTFRRRDNFLRMRSDDGGRIEVTQGHCRIETFSGFPAKTSSIP